MKKVQKTFLVDYDQIVLFIMICLTAFGLFIQLNIGSSLGDSRQMSFFVNQLKWVIFSIPVFFVTFKIKKIPDILYKFSFVFLLLVLGLLIAVLVKGATIQGGTRWIRLFGLTIQPSSLAHPVLIIFFAKYLDKKQDIIKKTGIWGFLKNFWFLIIISALFFVLIGLGRHLSTLIVLGATLLTIIFVAEFKMSFIILLMLILLTIAFGVIFSGPTYRAGRMEIYSKYSLFFKVLGRQKSEIKADAYQVRESLTAISRGGLFGTGITKGRAKHKYLPDINSDYVFSLIGEQFGFIGGLIVILLYCVFFFRVFVITSYCDTFFKRILVYGLGANIFITALVNIGVSISALPSTGLPLPFISYGGSYLIANVAMTGIILNISSKRKTV